MAMNEPLIIPNLKTRAEMREHVYLAGGIDRCLVIVKIDVMRNANVIAMIKEMNAIQGHLRTLARIRSNCLDVDQRPVLPL